jgi:hypothetical protein
MTLALAKLLSTDDVSEMLGVSPRKVRDLPIPFVRVGKYRRYHPYHLDEFKNNPEDPWDDEITGRVYFLSTRCGRYVKIGYATDVSRRMTEIDLCHPEPLALLGSMPGNPRIEKFMHRKFKDLRVRGEWFHLAEEIQQYIRERVNKEEAYCNE